MLRRALSGYSKVTNTNLCSECGDFIGSINKILPHDAQLSADIIIANTKPAYDEHLLVLRNDYSAKPWEKWPSKVEECKSSIVGPLKKGLHEGFMVSEVVMKKMRVDKGDVLLLPQGWKFNVKDETELQKLITFLAKKQERNASFDDYLKGKVQVHDGSSKILKSTDSPLPVEQIKSQFMFVCGHLNRDARCGMLAPGLVEEFQKHIDGDVEVGIITHVGGHKYAGNVIYYDGNGHSLWFGKVWKPLVKQLVDSLKEKKLLMELYRGSPF